MTVLSRDLLRKLIIQEMKKPKLSSGLDFGDDDDFEMSDETLDIDVNTEFEDLYDWDDDDEDIEDLVFYDARGNPLGRDETLYRDNPDYRAEFDDLEDDTEEESDTEDREGNYPDYAVFGPDDETQLQIKQRVHRSADDMQSRIASHDPRGEANIRYAELMKKIEQGGKMNTGVVDVGDLPPDPEFMDTTDLPLDRKKLKEHINKQIRQSINRRLLAI